MSYKSKEKPEMEGPKDMGATSTVQIDSEVKVGLMKGWSHHYFFFINRRKAKMKRKVKCKSYHSLPLPSLSTL